MKLPYHSTADIHRIHSHTMISSQIVASGRFQECVVLPHRVLGTLSWTQDYVWSLYWGLYQSINYFPYQLPQVKVLYFDRESH